jgi:organic radical activating enzyme
MIQSIVLSVTYKCPIKCKYCGVNAGPHHKKKMSLQMIKDLIDEAVSIGTVEVVVFTGGEPFILGESLYKAVEYSANKNLLTRIVTNAYWATSLKKALTVLQRLKNIGLTEINYSCDDFHQEFIPLQRVKWACEAALELEIPALIASKGLKHSKITPQYLEDFFGKKLSRFKKGQNNPKNYVYNYGVTVPVGWESENLPEEELLWPPNEDNWKVPCESVLKSIVITPDGDLSICCGIGSNEIPETIIGNTSNKPLIDLLIEANNDLIINWLALEGPYGIMTYMQKRVPELKFKERYVNICHLCHDIFSSEKKRKVLSEIVEEVVPFLSLERAWVENHRDQLNKLQVHH